MSGHHLDVTDLSLPRYGQLSGTPQRPDVPVPDPQFPHPEALAGRRSNNQQAGLPVRSPGTHLHPLLRRALVAGSAGGGSR